MTKYNILSNWHSVREKFSTHLVQLVEILAKSLISICSCPRGSYVCLVEQTKVGVHAHSWDLCSGLMRISDTYGHYYTNNARLNKHRCITSQLHQTISWPTPTHHGYHTVFFDFHLMSSSHLGAMISTSVVYSQTVNDYPGDCYAIWAE